MLNMYEGLLACAVLLVAVLLLLDDVCFPFLCVLIEICGQLCLLYIGSFGVGLICLIGFGRASLSVFCYVMLDWISKFVPYDV